MPKTAVPAQTTGRGPPRVLGPGYGGGAGAEGHEVDGEGAVEGDGGGGRRR